MIRAVLLVSVLGPVATAGAQDAFRHVDIDLRDPHVFIDFVGCRDVTDTPIVGFSVNGQIATSITTDGNGDGDLDSSSLVEFLPLDTALPTNLIDSGSARCTTAPTTCRAFVSSGLAGDATLATTGTCLSVISGTLRPYTPAVAVPGAPCFTSPVGSLTLDLGGISVPLQQASFAARFQGTPVDTLETGLMRGFVSEAAANATVIPNTYPVIGGRTLASLFPGGTGNCAAHDDRDQLDGVSGWWFYIAFNSQRVPLAADTFANGFADSFEDSGT